MPKTTKIKVELTPLEAQIALAEIEWGETYEKDNRRTQALRRAKKKFIAALILWYQDNPEKER